MPDFNDTKKHVVKISPVITPGNEGLVHHILVYGCKDDFPVSNLSVEGACFGSNMPDHVQSCAAQSVVASWAIGGGVNRTDQSGIRFHYTSSLRKYDADILWVGWAVSPFMWIPPYQKQWNSIGYCPSSCTQLGLANSSLPEGGIKVFSAILHSHLLGKYDNRNNNILTMRTAIKIAKIMTI
ncbi:DBH-like monooxygenase protein 1 [Exaiptasia diaphana]|uniref:DOMON domain-containing protein n=1 Tax=Exaiptasia diaphana TaxID=2652724 RepID=A0A913X3G1_EXADI|nr:DBH-like monooxygenase protein 1 [Exaiptasia diaphana]